MLRWVRHRELRHRLLLLLLRLCRIVEERVVLLCARIRIGLTAQAVLLWCCLEEWVVAVVQGLRRGDIIVLSECGRDRRGIWLLISGLGHQACLGGISTSRVWEQRLGNLEVQERRLQRLGRCWRRRCWPIERVVGCSLRLLRDWIRDNPIERVQTGSCLLLRWVRCCRTRRRCCSACWHQRPSPR